MAHGRSRLAARRKAVGYSQEALATRLGVERSTVVRWECGATAPHPWHRSKLAGALKLSLDELAQLLGEAADGRALPDAPEPAATTHDAHRSEFGDANRREVVRLLGVASLYVGAQPPGVDVEHLDRTAIHPRRLDDPTLAEFGELNSHLWRVFSLASSKSIALPMVRQQLNVLTEAIQSSPAPDRHARLCGLIGDLAQLAGEILFDGNKYEDAAQCYSLAAAASKEAGAHDLWACAVARHAFIEIFERRFHQALALLDLASRIADRGDPALTTRQWISAAQARAFAGLGDFAACQAALDRAAAVRQVTDPGHNGGWLRFDASRLAEEEGACYTALRRPNLAEQALAVALSQSLSGRRYACVLVDLASLCAQRGEIDQLVSHALAAAEIARHTGSGVVARRLQLLEPTVAPLMADRRVKELWKEIRRLTAHH